MTEIDRQHRVVEKERGRPDQEIGERNHDAEALLLRIQPAGKPGSFRSQGIHRDRRQQFLDEGLAACAPSGGISAVDTVDELDDSDGRQSCVLIASGLSVPRGRNERVAMAAHNRLEIATEVGVERCVRAARLRKLQRLR